MYKRQVIILVMDKKPGKQEGTQEAAITSETDQGAEGESMIQEETPEDSGQVADGEKSQIAPDNSQYTADFSQYELRKDELTGTIRRRLFMTWIWRRYVWLPIWYRVNPQDTIM